MVNGKPGDHPLTDMLLHGKHPFPADIESLLREVLTLDRDFPDGKRRYIEQVQWDDLFFAWEHGEKLAEGRKALHAVLGELRRAKSPPKTGG